MTSKDHNSIIQESLIDIFHFVSLLNETISDDSSGFDVVERKISELFDKSVEKSLVLGVDARDYDQARFAVCAWVDEVIMNMNWKYSNKWRNTLRQMKHYGTTNGGVEFFERLKTIGPKNSGVREIYFVCLGLGFSGQYSGENNYHLLREIIISNYNLLQNESVPLGKIENKFSKLAYDTENTQNNIRLIDSFKAQVKGQLKLAAWILPPILVSALYIWYSLLLDTQLSSLIVKISG